MNMEAAEIIKIRKKNRICILYCDTHQWANPEQQHPIGKVSDMNIYQMNEWFSSSLGYTAHIPALCRSPSILPAF